MLRVGIYQEGHETRALWRGKKNPSAVNERFTVVRGREIYWTETEWARGSFGQSKGSRREKELYLAAKVPYQRSESSSSGLPKGGGKGSIW